MNKQAKNWLKPDLPSILVLLLDCPCCSKAQGSKQSTGTWLCPRWHMAGRPGWTTLWKHTSQRGHLISSPSVWLHKDNCHLRGRMCLAEGEAIPEHWDSCLSHPWNSNKRFRSCILLKGSQWARWWGAPWVLLYWACICLLLCPSSDGKSWSRCPSHPPAVWTYQRAGELWGKDPVSDIEQEPNQRPVSGKGRRASCREKLLLVLKKWIFTWSILSAVCEQVWTAVKHCPKLNSNYFEKANGKEALYLRKWSTEHPFCKATAKGNPSYP